MVVPDLTLTIPKVDGEAFKGCNITEAYKFFKEVEKAVKDEKVELGMVWLGNGVTEIKFGAVTFGMLGARGHGRDQKTGMCSCHGSQEALAR